MAYITKTSEVFKAAKAKVWNGKTRSPGIRFICIAVDDLQYCNSNGICITKAMRDKICRLIDKRLEGRPSLSTWLHHYHPELFNGSKSIMAYERKMQQTRHAWLDSLIAEFQAMGD
jgi:hypothetical protein